MPKRTCLTCWGGVDPRLVFAVHCGVGLRSYRERKSENLFTSVVELGMAMPPRRKEPPLGALALICLARLQCNMCMSATVWTVDECSLSSSYSLHGVVVAQADAQVVAEKLRGCVEYVHFGPPCSGNSNTSLHLLQVCLSWNRIEQVYAQRDCVAKFACLRRSPALFARMGMREMMAPSDG